MLRHVQLLPLQKSNQKPNASYQLYEDWDEQECGAEIYERGVYIVKMGKIKRGRIAGRHEQGLFG